MHMFLDNFHQGGKYSAQMASHQVDLSREVKCTHQKYLSISSLQADYLNLDSSSGCDKNSERADIVQTTCNFVEVTKVLQKNVTKGSEKKRKISFGW